MKLIKLPTRLKTIAEYIDYNSSVLDVGTNHGKLAVYLAQINPERDIIATDISANSLKAALITAKKYNVTENIDFFVTPGLDDIDLTNINVIVIAGLGGETIAQIISETVWQKNTKIELILQPQSKTDKLCKLLYDKNYHISKIKTIIDNKREYTIIKCSVGG
ncbi:MAG: class I SAM-dependent methyltransferase [Oscillospiraceae bacterium]|jgi:tRNA A22 N-methylase|nr:class I SAM-dependent methyltransferase [Oscillospiraceae bacterium]